jgi:hypothetical protein
VCVLSAFIRLKTFSKLQVQWGVMGGVTSIPPSFSISFALACASSINAAVHAYGLLLTSSRPRVLASQSSPFELRFLGYATDNGAYYYYKVHTRSCC